MPGSSVSLLCSSAYSFLSHSVDFMILHSDPEMTFFKKDMGLRDGDIQHVFEDAIKFYNETMVLTSTLHQMNKMSTSLRMQICLLPV